MQPDQSMRSATYLGTYSRYLLAYLLRYLGIEALIEINLLILRIACQVIRVQVESTGR